MINLANQIEIKKLELALIKAIQQTIRTEFPLTGVSTPSGSISITPLQPKGWELSIRLNMNIAPLDEKPPE